MGTWGFPQSPSHTTQPVTMRVVLSVLVITVLVLCVVEAKKQKDDKFYAKKIKQFEKQLVKKTKALNKCADKFPDATDTAAPSLQKINSVNQDLKNQFQLMKQLVQHTNKALKKCNAELKKLPKTALK